MAIKPKGDLVITRFYLSTDKAVGPSPEPLNYEVPKAAWVAAERGAGFRGHRDGEPATAGFGGYGIRGTQGSRWTTVRIQDAMVCGNCGLGITLVSEQWYGYGPGVDGVNRSGIEIRDLWRHTHEEFPHSLGPVECDLPVVRFEATPQES